MWRYFAPFYDVILSIDHVSLTLDGETSFSCFINIRNTCKRLSYIQTVGRISSVEWQKVEESVGYNCFFIIFSSPEPKGSLVSLMYIHGPSSSVRRRLSIRRPPFSILPCWAYQRQISYRASVEWGNESLFERSGSRDQDGRHAHIW